MLEIMTGKSSEKPKGVKAQAGKAKVRTVGARSKPTEKRPEGRPAKFTDAELFAQKVDEYFKTTGYTIAKLEDGAAATGPDGKPIIIQSVPTITGLALHLGFESRQSIYDYAEKGEFAYVIKKARLRIEAFVESDLLTTRSPTGAIFWLKNHGWADKTEVDNNIHTDEGLTLVLNMAAKA